MIPDSITQNRIPLRKLSLRLGVLIILFIVGYFVVKFVTSGTITVTTGSTTASITISSLPPLQRGNIQAKSATTRTGTGSLSVRVPAGVYSVSVQDGVSQESRSITVGWQSHQHVNIKLSSPSSTEPVLYDSVQNIAADESRLIYLANNSSTISYVNTHNQETTIGNYQNLSSVAWANAQYGVAQDNAGNLFVIDGDSMHSLQSPLNSQRSVSGTSYAVAPNKTIYIAYGSKVYRGTEKNGFAQIYNNFSSSDSLIAANNKVMIIDPNTGGSTESGAATIITTNGQQYSKNFGYPVSGWSPWSPNGNYIVVSVNSEPEVFNASLNQVGTVPQTVNLTGGAWLGDNTLFYGYEGQLLSYDVSQNALKIVAALPDNKVIQGVTVSDHGSYVYLTASNSTTDVYPRVVYRLGLRGQSVPSDLRTLGQVLPINTSTYTIGLRNFSGTPTIDVTAYPGTDPNIALQSAQQAVQGIVNINDVNFDVQSGD